MNRPSRNRAAVAAGAGLAGSLAADIAYRVFEGAGHFLQLESSELFNRAVREFLQATRLLERRDPE